MQEWQVTDQERLRNQDRLPSRVYERDPLPPHPRNQVLPQDRPRTSDKQRLMFQDLLLTEAQAAAWPALEPWPGSSLPRILAGRAAWQAFASHAPIEQLRRVRELLTNCPALFRRGGSEPEFGTYKAAQDHYNPLIRRARDPVQRQKLLQQRREAIAAIRERQANQVALEAGGGPAE